MKVLFILLLGAAVALGIKSVANGPKNLPSQFTATFNETDFLNPLYDGGVRTLYWDANNKRARETKINKNNQLQDNLLLFQAPGASPGSPAANGYTNFVINPEYPDHVPNNCYYQSTDGDASTPFHRVWDGVSPAQGRSQYAFDFEYPEMVYGGVQYVPEVSAFADRWDSVKTCKLHVYGYIPCMTVWQSRDSFQLTLKEVKAYGAVNVFDSDVYLVRVFSAWEVDVSDNDFDLPQAWPSSCGYADSGYKFSQFTMIYAESTSSNFSLSLQAPPVQSAGGQVKVTLVLQPTSRYNCSDCVTLSTQTFIFDSTNWNVPQYLWLDYVATGCELFALVGSGGGYDWQYDPYYNYAFFESCHYDPTWGYCKERNMCGNK